MSKLDERMFVGCPITSLVLSRLVEAARRLGCKTSTGSQMYNALQNSTVDFLLEGGGSR